MVIFAKNSSNDYPNNEEKENSNKEDLFWDLLDSTEKAMFEAVNKSDFKIDLSDFL